MSIFFNLPKATCCEKASEWFREYPYDQLNDGLRNVSASLSNGAGSGLVRLRYCPFCGEEFVAPATAPAEAK